MKHFLYSIFFISIISIVIAGCDEEKKKEGKIINQNPNNTDTSSVIIKYDVSGTGNGKITLAKKGGKIKLTLEKTVNGQNNIETRFISDGWIYFYFTTETSVQPVKSKINKDHNYLKNFAALADADEIISKMRKSGNEIVSGFTCDIYESNLGAVYSIYNGKYVLKSSFDGIIITANTVSFNAPIKNEDVEKPAGIEFLELTVGQQ